ncbi:Uncharacterised protein [Mycobacterium tuberculosis]|nr:Uncharacterised protein [Mycobacterium tuberculosis]
MSDDFVKAFRLVKQLQLVQSRQEIIHILHKLQQHLPRFVKRPELKPKIRVKANLNSMLTRNPYRFLDGFAAA